jgi:putative flippase GtrA
VDSRHRAAGYYTREEDLRALSHGQKRVAIFAAVGATCFGVQLALLTLLVHLGANRPVANAVGFAISAQVNFLLSSKVTWRDRSVSGWRERGTRWVAYNGTALVSLGINTAVFTLVYHAIGTAPASALGVLIGTVVVYLICNLLIFRGANQKPAADAQLVLTTDPDQAVAQ